MKAIDFIKAFYFDTLLKLFIVFFSSISYANEPFEISNFYQKSIEEILDLDCGVEKPPSKRLEGILKKEVTEAAKFIEWGDFLYSAALSVQKHPRFLNYCMFEKHLIDMNSSWSLVATSISESKLTHELALNYKVKIGQGKILLLHPMSPPSTFVLDAIERVSWTLDKNLLFVGVPYAVTNIEEDIGYDIEERTKTLPSRLVRILSSYQEKSILDESYSSIFLRIGHGLSLLGETSGFVSNEFAPKNYFSIFVIDDDPERLLKAQKCSCALYPSTNIVLCDSSFLKAIYYLYLDAEIHDKSSAFFDFLDHSSSHIQKLEKANLFLSWIVVHEFGHYAEEHYSKKEKSGAEKEKEADRYFRNYLSDLGLSSDYSDDGGLLSFANILEMLYEHYSPSKGDVVFRPSLSVHENIFTRALSMHDAVKGSSIAPPFVPLNTPFKDPSVLVEEIEKNVTINRKGKTTPQTLCKIARV